MFYTYAVIDVCDLWGVSSQHSIRLLLLQIFQPSVAQQSKSLLALATPLSLHPSLSLSVYLSAPLSSTRVLCGCIHSKHANGIKTQLKCLELRWLTATDKRAEGKNIWIWRQARLKCSDGTKHKGHSAARQCGPQVAERVFVIRLIGLFFFPLTSYKTTIYRQ